jgi:hypothetical protein
MIAFNAVGRMSALFLFFILYANNIVYSNAQPTLAPTMSTGAQNYTVTQVSGDNNESCLDTVAIEGVTNVLTHALYLSLSLPIFISVVTSVQHVDGLILATPARTLEFKLAFKDAVSKVLGIEKSAVVVYSTNVASDRRLMEVSDGRKLDGAVAGVSAVYIVRKSGTTAIVLATVLTASTAIMSNTLSSAGFTGTTIEEAKVTLGNPSASTTTTTGSKSSASSGTRSHVAIMISALAVVVMQSVLL